MRVLEMIVLVLAAVSLLKGVFCLVRPEKAQKVVEWWLKAPAGVFRALGVACVVVGVVFVGLAVARIGQATIAVVNIAGSLLVFAGLAYMRPALVQTMLRPFSPEGRSVTMRLAGVAAVAFGLVLLLIFLKVIH